MNLTKLFFPRKCIFCGQTMESEDVICSGCDIQSKVISGRICAKCGREVPHCMCGFQKRFYDRSISCFYYEGCVRRGVLRFKFHRKTMLDGSFAKFMSRLVSSRYDQISFDAICYVPCHWIRKFARGYNCSELLAKRIGEELNLPVWDTLYKTRYTPQQKRKKTNERSGNVLDSFGVRGEKQLSGKTLLLVDDIVTSGATLSECAKILKMNGAAKVYCVTFAAVGKNRS